MGIRSITGAADASLSVLKQKLSSADDGFNRHVVLTSDGGYCFRKENYCEDVRDFTYYYPGMLMSASAPFEEFRKISRQPIDPHANGYTLMPPECAKAGEAKFDFGFYSVGTQPAVNF